MSRTSLFFIKFLLIISACTDGTDKSAEVSEVLLETSFEDPPQWSKEVIWYQIFVDRFRNGDPANDPRPGDIKGAYPGFVPPNWQITPWTQDWYSDDVYFDEAENEKDLDGNYLKNFGQKLQLRRYGGDLQGVLDQLDYLDSLGITAVYFNPLNDAPSMHKYDARYWRHIDKNFGPSPEKDAEVMISEDPNDFKTWKFTEADKMFLKVIRELHDRGIKLILDYSWNHTGIDFWAWKDVLQNQEDSKFKDWFWIKSFDNPETEENEFEYRGWAGVSTLPEILETEFIDHSRKVTIAEGNIKSEEVKQLIFNISKRWLDPNNDGNPEDGVDGFRLDVAAEVPLGFWREYRKVVRGVNPDAYLLGEIWWEEWPDKLLDPKPFLEGDVFDAPMNYRWYRAARHFFNQSPDKILVSEFVDSLKSFSSNLRHQSNYAMMNLTSSHDVPRVLTSLFNKNKYKFNSSPNGSNNYKIHKPDEGTYTTLKLLLAHQFTYVGSPHIWAGDEMGMWGADDPSCRKPLIWPDYEFEPESTHPLGEERPTDSVRFNDELFSFYQKLIDLRTGNDVLKNGDLEYTVIDNERDVLAYSRFDESGEIIVIFNTGQVDQQVGVSPRFAREYVSIFGNDSSISADNGKLEVEISARSFLVLKSG